MRPDADVVLSGALLAVFAAMTAGALLYPPDSRLLPLVVGIPGIFLCAAQLVCALVARQARPLSEGQAGNR